MEIITKKAKGRPLKYGEPLIPVTFRIPESKVDAATKWVGNLKKEAFDKIVK